MRLRLLVPALLFAVVIGLQPAWGVRGGWLTSGDDAAIEVVPSKLPFSYVCEIELSDEVHREDANGPFMLVHVAKASVTNAKPEITDFSKLDWKIHKVTIDEATGDQRDVVVQSSNRVPKAGHSLRIAIYDDMVQLSVEGVLQSGRYEFAQYGSGTELVSARSVTAQTSVEARRRGTREPVRLGLHVYCEKK